MQTRNILVTVLCLPVVFFFFASGIAQAQYRTLFSPSITVSEEYTDNLFLTDEDEESEFLTVIAPRAAFSVEGKTFGWELAYEPGFTFYNQHDELNTVRHSASLDGRHQLTKRLSLTLADNFTRTEEPYRRADISFRRPRAQVVTLEELIDYTIRTSREPRYTNDALARLDYQFGADDRVYAAFNHRIFRDENPRGEDSQRYTPSVGFEHWLDTWNGLRGDLSYTRGLFEEETDDFHDVEGNLRFTHKFDRFLGGFVEYTHLYTNFDDAEDDYHVYNPAAGVNYTFAEDAFIEASLGYFIQDRETGDNESGITVNLDIGKSWRYKRWAFRLNGSSGYEQTYFRSENLGFTEFYQVRGGLDYNFTRYLRASLSADYRFSQYLDVEPEREDHIATASGGLTYQATQWLSFSLSDTYRVVESDAEFNDYRENRVVLSVSIAPKPMAIAK
jgi:hypothetical protein